MNSRRAGMVSVADVLFELRTKGVRLWVNNAELRYESLNGALTSDIVRTIRALRVDITNYLEKQASSAAPYALPLEQRPTSDPVPLTFSQKWHWNLLGPD